MGLANVAAQIHYNMCTDDRFGYSWDPRWGTDGAGYVTWNIEGRDYTVKIGDYDCSSSAIIAWKTALQGTPYEGKLDRATYTGNMRSIFVASGLFDVWDVNSTAAVRGDLYLNDNHHVAMCQDGGSDGVLGYDALSEFSSNEFGEVYGGRTGDQSGREAHVHEFYNYPWSCTLHYNGKADGAVNNTPSKSEDSVSYNQSVNGEPTYAVYTAEAGWLDTMRGRIDTGGSGDDYAGVFGTGIRYIGIEGVGKYRVCDLDNGWWPFVDHFDKNDEDNGMAGAGSTITALEIPDNNIKYQVHTIQSGWLPEMQGNVSSDGSSDTFAGEMGEAIDAVRIWKA